MAKLKNQKPSIQKAVTSHPKATTNKAGGLAFNITDPAQKLVTMVGGQFFNEPSYYADDKIGKDGLTELARDVIASAKATAHSGTPTDLLSIANWLRNEKNVRTTAAVLYAVAAGEEKNRDRMVEYGPKILRRPDDVLQAFGAYIALYSGSEIKNGRAQNNATFPNSFKKGLAAAISKFDEFQLLKYESNEFPRWKDLLLVVDRRKDYPVPAALMNYFITGEVKDADATPILAARKQLAKMTSWNGDVIALAKRAHASWEILLSQFGNKKEVWEALIDGGRAMLPVMAAVRNLRNMEQVQISDGHWEKVRTLVMSADDNQMMPFRFISARKNTTNKHAVSIADILLDKACGNLPNLSGQTLVVVDHSGSMDTKISGKSEMTKKEAGTALAAVIAKSNPANTETGTFGSTFALAPFSTADSAWRIYTEVEKCGRTTGYSTEAHKIFEFLISKRMKVDRVFVLSDMQCYGGYGGGGLAGAYLRYKQQVNPNCRLISVDLGGYGQSQFVPDDKLVYLSTGYTEDLIKEVHMWESGEVKASDGSISTVPSLDYIRTNF